MSTQQEKTPLEEALTKFKASCESRYGSDPSKEQVKEILQNLIDEETDFYVKIALTQLWQLTKDYHSDINWHDRYVGRSAK